MSYEAYKATLGPTVQELDQELRDASDATLQRYAAQFDPAQVGGRPFEATPVEQRRAMRANNETARRSNEKERDARRAAEDARSEAAHNARIQAEIDSYRKQVQGAFPGTAAQFEAAWPRILEDWQIEQARARIDAMTLRIRSSVGGF